MTQENIWTKLGFRWNEKEQCYERPVKKTERQGAHVFNLPEQAGSGVQEQQGNRKKRDVHKSGTKKKNAGNNNLPKRSILLNFKFPNYSPRDIDNCTSTVMDCLRDAGIIPDDSVSHVQRIFAGFTISEVPGVEIIITEHET